MAQPARLVPWTLQTVSRPYSLPPAFLLPSFATRQTARFSSTPQNAARKDGNKHRGESALRRTGPRKSGTPSVDPTKLPRPVSRDSISPIQVDKDHGLHQFFFDKTQPFPSVEFMNAHGRAWAVPELRERSWEDLHSLWWTCVRERNMISTAEVEMRRTSAGYGQYESQARDKEVRQTMKAIKIVLTERFYAWEDARRLVESDPEINVNAGPDEPVYTPREDKFIDEPETPKLEEWSSGDDGSARDSAQIPDTPQNSQRDARA